MDLNLQHLQTFFFYTGQLIFISTFYTIGQLRVKDLTQGLIYR